MPRPIRAVRSQATAATPATLMDVEDGIANGDVSMAAAERDADDDASSGLSDGSGDDYVAPEDAPQRPADEPEQDDVFK